MGKYSIISFEKRKQLIKQIIEQKKPLKNTAQKMNIKLSTAKQIIRKYRTKGKIFQKKQLKHQIKAQFVEEITFPLIEQNNLQNQRILSVHDQNFYIPHFYNMQNQIQHSGIQSGSLQNIILWNQYWWFSTSETPFLPIYLFQNHQQ